MHLSRVCMSFVGINKTKKCVVAGNQQSYECDEGREHEGSTYQRYRVCNIGLRKKRRNLPPIIPCLV